MINYPLVFGIVGVLGFIIAIIAEVDIFRHRRDHERRRHNRRASDRRCDCLDGDAKTS